MRAEFPPYILLLQEVKTNLAAFVFRGWKETNYVHDILSQGLNHIWLS